jgi:hypothetical protein
MNDDDSSTEQPQIEHKTDEERTITLSEEEFDALQAFAETEPDLSLLESKQQMEERLNTSSRELVDEYMSRTEECLALNEEWMGCRGALKALTDSLRGYSSSLVSSSVVLHVVTTDYSLCVDCSKCWTVGVAASCKRDPHVA